LKSSRFKAANGDNDGSAVLQRDCNKCQKRSVFEAVSKPGVLQGHAASSVVALEIRYIHQPEHYAPCDKHTLIPFAFLNESVLADGLIPILDRLASDYFVTKRRAVRSNL
jgi:hypothetical protein